MVSDASKNIFDLKRQILTSFPNQNEKHIDFVIVYKVLEEIPENLICLSKQVEFFTELKRQSFDIYEISPSVTGENFSYALLHCNKERLLKEAENIRLRMQIKDVCLYVECPWIKKFLWVII